MKKIVQFFMGLLGVFFYFPSLATSSLGLPEASHLPPFYNINCSGHLKVNIVSSRNQRISLVKNRNDHEVSYRVEKDVLLIEAKEKEKEESPKTPSLLRVTVFTPHLKNLAAQGNCQIIAKHINTYGMNIHAKDHSFIVLKGDKINVNTLDASDYSHIDIQWLNSQNLTVTAKGNSYITLAGMAKAMHLKTMDDSHVHADYLRTGQVVVLTAHRSYASVLPLTGLRAFAKDQSEIDYYKIPKAAMVLTHLSGNVLQTGYRN